jgi:F0F1-type ATP synthase membrane subunit b/b'
MIVAAALCPTLAFAAEGEEPAGSYWVLILYAINFLLFLWVVNRYARPAIVSFFQNRARTIRDNINGAQKAYRDAQELANRAAEQLARVEAEKTRLATELADETSYQVGRIREAAREAVQRLQRDNELTSTALREAGRRRMRQAMAEAAGRLARQMLTRDFGPSDQVRLLDGFVERIDEEARP